MSAFMLTAAHFDAMADYLASKNVNPAYVLRYGEHMEAASAEFLTHTRGVMPDGLRAYRALVGEVLHHQNERSMRHLYSDVSADEIGDAYVCQRVAVTMTARRALAAVACYEYQACETPDFKRTLAYAFCRMIEAAAISELREGEPWGLTEEHVRPAGAPIPVSLTELLASRRTTGRNN